MPCHVLDETAGGGVASVEGGEDACSPHETAEVGGGGTGWGGASGLDLGLRLLGQESGHPSSPSAASEGPPPPGILASAVACPAMGPSIWIEGHSLICPPVTPYRRLA